jgi:flagellar M-ring protein FliF
VEEAEMPVWKDPGNVALVKELLKNLFIFGLAFYLVFGVLRPLLRDLLRPPEPAAAGGGALGEELEGGFEGLGQAASPEMRQQADKYQNNIGSVREFAKQNPKVVAEVVKDWMAKE